jgi:hypothetical protein
MVPGSITTGVSISNVVVTTIDHLKEEKAIPVTGLGGL